MKQKILILLGLLLGLTMSVTAQNKITVSGTVTDEELGETLIGVAVTVEGAKGVGTVTDFDGKYELEVASNASLKFSYVGYESKIVKVNGQATIDIVMSSSTKMLDELVVIGYTVQKKRDVLGAVNKVDNKELTVIPVGTPDLALQGRAPGVQVTSGSGAPGAGVSVRVRGVGSISSGNEPLYIIDGIQTPNGMSAISPSDIENIVVLKDAASTAIYGSQGSNGIVLITTKTGKKGESKITYNTQMGFQQHAKLPKMVNTSDYIKLYNEATTTDNAISAIGIRPLIDGAYLNNLAYVNHLEEIFRTAPLQSHELSISGGNEKTTYLLSASYFDQQGIIKNSGYNKVNVRSNINTEVKSWLSVGLNMSGGMANTESIPSSGDGYKNSEGGSALRYAMFRNPAVPVYDKNGGYVDKPSEYFGNPIYDTLFGDGYNPVGYINNINRERKEKTFLGSTNFVIKLPKNITSKTVMGLDYMTGNYRTISTMWGTGNRISNPSSLALEKYENMAWTVNSVLTHNISINKVHNLSSMIGTEAFNKNYKTSTGSDHGYVDNMIILDNGSDTAKRSVGEGAISNSLVSFFGTINYNYNSKYYAALTVRRDGSSKFAKKNQWGTFYSISGGWNIEQESFMKSLKDIDVLKLRAGWGTVGNQNIPLYSLFDRYSNGYDYPFGGVRNQGFSQSKMGNEDLRWEISQQFDIGLDMAFFKNSLGFTVDYFHKVSKHMLMDTPLPASIGNNVETIWVNNGEMLNTGFDVEVFYRKDYKDAGFDLRLNGGYLKNKVLKMDSQLSGGRVDAGLYATRTEVGQPVGSFYMLEMDGIFQNMSDVYTSAFQGNNIAPGDVKYKDHYQDNVIDDKDRVHLGSAIPKFTLGSNLSGHWKDFDASLFFQGAFGHKNYIQIFHDIEGFYRGFGVTQRYFDNHWTGEGTSNTQPRASWKSKSNNVRVSSRFLEDASYLRLKNVQIGYTIPNTKKFGIEKLRVYVAGTNLLTFTKFPSIDPEMTVSANSEGEGDRAAGIDWGTYPIAKSYTFGINLTF